MLHHACFEHPELAVWLVEQGATVDIHAAAGLGDLDRLRALLERGAHPVYPDGATLAGPICPPVKWAVVARDATGGEHWAEAEIGAVPYGV